MENVYDRIAKYMELLKNSSLFSGLTSDEIECFLSNASFEIVEMSRNEELLVKLDKSIFVLQGLVAVYEFGEHGRKTFINQFSIDTNPLIPVNNRMSLVSVSVLAKKSSVILLLDTDSFLSTNPDLLMIQNKVQRNIIDIFYVMTENIMLRTMCNTETQARSKIIKFLTFQYKRCNNSNLTTELSRDDLANHLQIDTSTLMRELKKLKEEGIIDYSNKCISIVRPDLLPDVVEYN